MLFPLLEKYSDPKKPKLDDSKQGDLLKTWVEGGVSEDGEEQAPNSTVAKKQQSSNKVATK